MHSSVPPFESHPTRRDFLVSSGALAAGLTLAAAPRAQAQTEKLAIAGGPKTVTASDADACHWPQYGEAEEKAILDLVRKPSYDPLYALEDDWKKFLGVPYAKAHYNGTSALAAMFFALNLPKGSEILVPSYTFFATIVPMRLFGLVPVFVDINPRTLNFDLEDAKKRITKDTRAVLPVHWIGLPSDMDLISDWAKEKGLIVLEDCAHAHGAKLKDKYMGAWGQMSIVSYQMSKPLPAIEGGMGVYQTSEYHGRAAAFGDYQLKGVDKNNPYMKYAGSSLGIKFRMHPFAAALARCQLKGLEERNEAGARQVRRLNDRLTQLPGLYEQSSGRKDVRRLYYSWNMLFIDEKEAGVSRAKVTKALKAEGVNANPLHYQPQHELPLYHEEEWWDHKPLIPELPGTKQANDTSIALPYFTKEVPELIEQYAKAFEKVWAHRAELA